MNYLPELRDSLVKAAREQTAAAGAVAPRRRRGFGVLVPVIGVAAAVAVLVVALLAVRHQGSRPTAAGSRVAQAEAAARRILDEVVLPQGARRSRLGPGIPADLWKPSERLGVDHVVDLHQIWRLPESPKQVVDFLQAHPPAGSRGGMSSESGGG